MNHNICNVCRVGTVSLSQFTLDKALRICDNKDCTFIFETLPEDLIVDNTICSQKVLEKLDFLTYRKSRSENPTPIITETETRTSFDLSQLDAFSNNSQSSSESCNAELDDMLEDIFSTATLKSSCVDMEPASSQIKTQIPQYPMVTEQIPLNTSISHVVSANSEHLVVEIPESSPTPEAFVDNEGNTYMVVDMNLEELLKQTTDRSTMESGLSDSKVFVSNLPSCSPAVSCGSSDSGFEDMDTRSSFENKSSSMRSYSQSSENDIFSNFPAQYSSVGQPKAWVSNKEVVSRYEKSRHVTFSCDTKFHDIPFDDGLGICSKEQVSVAEYEKKSNITCTTKEVRVSLKRLRESDIEHFTKRRALDHADTPVPKVIHEEELPTLLEAKIAKTGKKRGRPRKSKPPAAEKKLGRPRKSKPTTEKKLVQIEPHIVEKVEAQLKFVLEQDPNVSSLVQVTVNGQRFMCRPLS